MHTCNYQLNHELASSILHPPIIQKRDTALYQLYNPNIFTPNALLGHPPNLSWLGTGTKYAGLHTSLSLAPVNPDWFHLSGTGSLG